MSLLTPVRTPFPLVSIDFQTVHVTISVASCTPLREAFITAEWDCCSKVLFDLYYNILIFISTRFFFLFFLYCSFKPVWSQEIMFLERDAYFLGSIDIHLAQTILIRDNPCEHTEMLLLDGAELKENNN